MRQDLRDRVRARVAGDAQLTDPADVAALRDAVARALRAEGGPDEGLPALVRQLGDELVGLGPLAPLLRDAAVTDVLVNGPGEVWVERGGRLELTDVGFRDAAALHDAVQRLVTLAGARLDRRRPYVDAHLPDGSRLHAVLPPVAPAGPVVTIRRFAAVPELDDRAIPQAARELLHTAVAERRAIVLCGRTGTGKTTLLGTLLGFVAPTERVVLVEDVPEVRSTCRHLVRLETRPASADGGGEVTLRDLVRQALRMRPDRIVLGEVRGVEVADVLQALATGHEGGMTTVHARSAAEALLRLEGLALQAGLPLAAARAQLGTAVDVVVALGRAPDGCRGVVEIADVQSDCATTLRWRRRSWEER